MIHHEEKSNYYPENLLNFTNHLVSKIEEVNGTLTFKRFKSKPDRLNFVEAKKKEICPHENYKNWTLFRRRELNRKKTIMSIWNFKRKRD